MSGKPRTHWMVALRFSRWTACITAISVVCAAVVTIPIGRGASGIGSDRSGGQGLSADAGAIARVSWSGIAKYGIADLATDGTRVWLATLGPALKPNLYRVDSTALTVRKVGPNAHFLELFAGDGQLWGVDDFQRLWLLRFGGRRSISTTLPRGCRVRGGAVFHGTVWLACDGYLAAYSAPSLDRTRVVASKSFVVLATRNGLWDVHRGRLRAVDGPSRGVTARLPSKSRFLQAAGNEVWGVDFGDVSHGPRLFHVPLDRKGSRPSVGPELDGAVNDLEVVGSEIWIANGRRPLIDRFSRASTPSRRSQIDLRGFVRGSDFDLFEHASSRFVWIEVRSGLTFKLLRIRRP